MAESIGKYPENNQLSINENTDSNFTNSKESTNNQTIDIENSMQKSKAYSVLNTLDSQGEKISKENEKLYISLLEKKDIKFLNDLTKKPKNEIKQFFIQAQIDELNKKADLTDSDAELDRIFAKIDKLEQEKTSTLIVSKDAELIQEKRETKDNENLIAEENEKQAKLAKVSARLDSIEGSLLSLKGQNKNTDEIFSLIAESKKYDKGKETTSEDIDKMEGSLKKVIEILKTKPLVLKSIADDLKKQDRENGTNNFEKFRNTLIEIDPSFNEILELDFVGKAAQMKLGTSNLNGVDLESHVLSKTEDGITTSFSDEEGRFLNSTGNDFKLKSELDSDNEEKLREVNTQANEILEPINNSLNIVSGILDFIQKAKDIGADFDKTKQQIKLENPDLYSELGLENKNSFNEMIGVINTKKQELEKEKKIIMKKAKFRINELIEKNTQEAKEKDENKKQIIKFFDDIGLTKLRQTEFKKVLKLVNISPGNYGLTMPIDLENGSIGFNKDFGNAKISEPEKLAFVKFFNKMLGEDVVRINEELQTIIPLDSSDENKLEKLSNKKVGFFMENLEKKNR